MASNQRDVQVLTGVDQSGNPIFSDQRIHRKNLDAVKADTWANQFQLALQQYQNWYNTPGHQKELYLEAGLNPNLMNGSYSSSASDSGSFGYDADSLDVMTPLDYVQTGLGALKGSIDSVLAAKQLKLQNEQLDLDTRRVQVEEKDLQRKELETNATVAKTNKEIEALGKQMNLTDQEIENLKSTNLNVQANTSKILADVDLVKSQTKTSDWQREADKLRLKMEQEINQKVLRNYDNLDAKDKAVLERVKEEYLSLVLSNNKADLETNILRMQQGILQLDSAVYKDKPEMYRTIMSYVDDVTSTLGHLLGGGKTLSEIIKTVK